ncbi:hypothetical protein ACC754_41520, partial [Rhizobium johnstonii]
MAAIRRQDEPLKGLSLVHTIALPQRVERRRKGHQTYTIKQLAQGHRTIRIGFFLVPDFPLM